MCNCKMKKKKKARSIAVKVFLRTSLFSATLRHSILGSLLFPFPNMNFSYEEVI